MRWFGVLVLVALFCARIDVWWWREPRLVLGMPLGLTFHLVYCFLVSIVMALLVRVYWPKGLDDGEDSGA